jgi:GNAT superfamily N-acetyltransferase
MRGEPAANPSSDLMARCHQSYVEAFWQYTRACPGAARRTWATSPRSTAVRSGIASTVSNVLFLGPSDGSGASVVDQARGFFGPHQPWRVIALGDPGATLERSLTASHLRPAPREPGMIMAPMRPAPALPTGLTVRLVSNAEELESFAEVWCTSFRVPRWIFPLVLPSIPGEDPEHGTVTRLLVGFAQERPVACSSVVVAERVGNIVSVGTVPPARGRGYGAALTWRAAQEGHDLGAEAAYLAATPMGYPVYERMGFQRVAEYPTWEHPIGVARQLWSFFRLWRASRRDRHAGGSPARG